MNPPTLCQGELQKASNRKGIFFEKLGDDESPVIFKWQSDNFAIVRPKKMTSKVFYSSSLKTSQFRNLLAELDSLLHLMAPSKYNQINRWGADRDWLSYSVHLWTFCHYRFSDSRYSCPMICNICGPRLNIIFYSASNVTQRSISSYWWQYRLIALVAFLGRLASLDSGLNANTCFDIHYLNHSNPVLLEPFLSPYAIRSHRIFTKSHDNVLFL